MCIKTIPVAFFDSRGLIHEKFVPADTTINAEYYKGIMDQLLKWIAHIRPDFHISNNWLLLHNTLAHTTSVCQFLTKKVTFLSPLFFLRFGTTGLLFVSERSWFDDGTIQKNVTKELKAIIEEYKHTLESLGEYVQQCIYLDGIYIE